MLSSTQLWQMNVSIYPIKSSLVICIRWIDENLAAHEDFIGLHQLERNGADDMMVALKDVLLGINFRLQDARGQCYDGAATMAGHKTGIAAQIKGLNGKCLFIHCYGHALNLAVGDSIKAVSCLNETFEVVRARLDGLSGVRLQLRWLIIMKELMKIWDWW